MYVARMSNLPMDTSPDRLFAMIPLSDDLRHRPEHEGIVPLQSGKAQPPWRVRLVVQ